MYSLDIKLDQLCKELSIQECELEALIHENVWILSFSGGADSVLTLAFLILLHESSIDEDFYGLSTTKTRRLVLYYLDHKQKIEPLEQKKRDSVFRWYKQNLKNIQDLKVQWIKKEKPVEKIAKRLKSSFEHTGSKIRTKELRHLVKHFQGSIITGHQLSDWYETLIMRLNRGSSLTKLTPFGFKTKSFLSNSYHPLYFTFRHEVRKILEKYQISYWDDPSNQDTSILRNQIRDSHKIKNYSGLRKTASNILQEKEERAEFSGFNAEYFQEIFRVISPLREVHIPLAENFITMYKLLTESSQVNLQLFILRYLGLGAISWHHRCQILQKKFSFPPYYIEIENWNFHKYMVFRRGRSFFQEVYSEAVRQKKTLAKKMSDDLIIPANQITKHHKIKFLFGHKSVKALLREKSISKRQMCHLFVVLSDQKEYANQVVFIPLSLFGLKDIYAEGFHPF